jgi:uncharacterized membrane protein YvlD (DUF360 family)
MLLHFVVRIVLMVLALLIVVPAATGGAVAIRRGGLGWGLIVLVVQALVNSALWYLFAVLTAGGIIVANFVLFGLVGLLVNGLAFLLAGKLMPRHLHVESYGSAVWAALVMTVMSYAIHLLLA